jgi:curved DNA-binding protein CbpA
LIPGAFRVAGETTGDPFDVLGLEVGFDVSANAIERAYLARATRVHPDAGGAAEAASAAREMSRLNVARSTLLNAESRARAVLAAHTGEFGSDTSLPEGFLPEIMQTRMEIEEALASNDSDERVRWTSWAEGERARYVDEARVLFERLAAGTASAADVRKHLNAWRYIERLIEQLDPDYDPGRADLA